MDGFIVICHRDRERERSKERKRYHWTKGYTEYVHASGETRPLDVRRRRVQHCLFYLFYLFLGVWFGFCTFWPGASGVVVSVPVAVAVSVGDRRMQGRNLDLKLGEKLLSSISNHGLLLLFLLFYMNIDVCIREREKTHTHTDSPAPVADDLFIYKQRGRLAIGCWVSVRVFQIAKACKAILELDRAPNVYYTLKSQKAFSLFLHKHATHPVRGEQSKARQVLHGSLGNQAP